MARISVERVRTILRIAIGPLAFLAGMLLANSVRAGEAPADADAGASAGSASDGTVVAGEAWRETLTVERAERDEPKHATLKFLNENRDFFRGRLDQLLLTLGRERDGNARELDPRFLRYANMMAQIKAARDSAQVSEEWIRRRELLESVGDLVELESEMDEMETLLSEQRDRLVQLEEDFTGRQTTALVVLMTGVPSTGTPSAITLTDSDGTTTRIAFDAATQTALARGGSTELLHEYVEPRDLVYRVSFEGPGWESRAPFEVPVAPARDRLNFLELNVAGLDPASPSPQPTAHTWAR